MPIQYTCTFEDYSEANACVAAAKRAQPASKAAQVWTFVCLILTALIFVGAGTLPRPTVVDPAHPYLVTVHVLGILLPMAVFPALLLCMSIVTFIKRRLQNEKPDRPSEKSIRVYKPPRFPAKKGWWPILRRIFRRLFIGILVLYFIVLLPMISSGGSRTVALASPVSLWIYQWIVFGFSIAGVNYLTNRGGRLKATWAKNPYVELPKTLEFDETGVSIADEFHTTRYAWPAFTKLIETQNLFLLSISEITFHMIPKRAFATEQDVMIFTSLLTEHIGNGFVIAKAAGFPVQAIPMATLATPIAAAPSQETNAGQGSVLS